MFDNKTVGYLFLRLSSSMNSFRMNKFLMFFNIVKIYQSTQAVLNLAVFQFSFSYTKMKKGSRDGLLNCFMSLLPFFSYWKHIG